jgi:hypothetical protein
MSFSDNHVFIPGSLTTAANSISEEATASGTGSSVEYIAPANLDIEEFGILVAVTLGNSITTSTGYVLCKVDAAGTETILERLKPCNPAGAQGTTLPTLFAGDNSDQGGGTVVAATTLAFTAGLIINKTMNGTYKVLQGQKIRFRGDTTAGSATGDVVPFVVCRVAGKSFLTTNVYNEGVLTRNA